MCIVRKSKWNSLLVALWLPLALGQAAPDPATVLKEKSGGAESAVVEGNEGWLFLSKELESYAKPPFWGADAGELPPLPAIKDFHDQLAAAGIDLIVVPVPGKVAIYPDKLDDLDRNALEDVPHAQFITELQNAGVQVIDLAPVFRQMRSDGTDTHLSQDSHWTPQGLEAAVQAVAEKLKAADWYADAPKGKSETAPAPIEATGDLVTLGKLEGREAEAIEIQKTTATDGSIEDPDSPVVLIGDSHAIVYSKPISGGIQAEDAGFAERLFAETGLGSDVVVNQGSGVNAPRARLARRKGDQANLAGKKAVVWVFSARDFTEEPRGWAPIPVIR